MCTRATKRLSFIFFAVTGSVCQSTYTAIFSEDVEYPHRLTSVCCCRTIPLLMISGTRRVVPTDARDIINTHRRRIRLTFFSFCYEYTPYTLALTNNGYPAASSMSSESRYMDYYINYSRTSSRDNTTEEAHAACHHSIGACVWGVLVSVNLIEFGEVEEVRLVSYHGMKYSHFAPASH